jgi:hypothetical protein
MARRPSDEIETLLGRVEANLRRAFMESVYEIRDRAQVERVADRLRQGDVEGALRALYLNPDAYQRLDRAIRETYITGGNRAVADMQPVRDREGGKLVIRFDARNPSAEAWLADRSSSRIVEITDDQREAVRQAMRRGMEAGVNPRVTAIDIVGQRDPQTGRRQGGIIGLTTQQEGYVARARAELASGEAEQMRRYLGRARRDRSFDPIVRTAIGQEKPVSIANADRLISRYKDRLLALRGETIARTESLAALNASRHEAYRQAIEKGDVTPQQIRKTWVATKDNRTRDSHREIDRDTVGYNERFRNGLLYPHEPNAPAEEVINCRCRLNYRIDYFANLR